MFRTVKSLAACTALFALVLWISPQPSLAAGGSGARLEGLVLGLDGRAAAGHSIHLIRAGGEDLARSAVGEDGLYSFTGLGAGQYSLGVEMPDGTLAPVAAPPVRLGGNELARRDLKLVTSDAETTNAALQANHGLRQWWSELSTPGKAWTIVGIVVAAALVHDALDDDETRASPVGSGG
jgi:hypothetical protein